MIGMPKSMMQEASQPLGPAIKRQNKKHENFMLMKTPAARTLVISTVGPMPEGRFKFDGKYWYVNLGIAGPTGWSAVAQECVIEG